MMTAERTVNNKVDTMTWGRDEVNTTMGFDKRPGTYAVPRVPDVYDFATDCSMRVYVSVRLAKGKAVMLVIEPAPPVGMLAISRSP
ncbi:hypothetical protein SERLADRAFT_375326, partial [Serpula lacrymans var. lacrymans S7.9]